MRKGARLEAGVAGRYIGAMAHAVIYWFWRIFLRDWSPFEQGGVVVMRRPTRTGWETRPPTAGELEEREATDAW